MIGKVFCGYRSRSRAGMVNALVRDGMERGSARSEVEDWISLGKVVPTADASTSFSLAEGERKTEARTPVRPADAGRTGKSGRYYVENPFGKGDYAYAMFASRIAYGDLEPPRYVSGAEMLADMETVPYYRFDFEIAGEGRRYYTDTRGKLLDDPSTMDEMIALLWEIHGRENVKFGYERCITTSLASLG